MHNGTLGTVYHKEIRLYVTKGRYNIASAVTRNNNTKHHSPGLRKEGCVAVAVAGMFSDCHKIIVLIASVTSNEPGSGGWGDWATVIIR